jgi:hypothetical protein
VPDLHRTKDPKSHSRLTPAPLCRKGSADHLSGGRGARSPVA